MPAESSIYGLVDTQAPARLSSLLDPMNAKIRQAKQMELDDQMSTMQDKMALRDLLKTSGTRDPEQLAQMAYEKGLYGAGQDFSKQAQAVKQASLQEQKNKLDMANAQLAYRKNAQELASSGAGLIFANPTDENMKKLLLSQGVPENEVPEILERQIPKDILGRQRFMVAAFSDWKSRSEQMNPKQSSPTELSRLIAEREAAAKAGNAQAVRMYDSAINKATTHAPNQAAIQVPLQYLQTDQGYVAAPTRMTPGQQVTPQPVMVDGKQVKPVGAAGTGKLPAEIQRMNIAMRSLQTGLDAYENALTKFDPRSSDQINPTKRAAMESLRSSLLNQAKEADALGALTGPDLKLMNDLLGDPASFMGAVYGKGGMKAKITEARNALERRKQALRDQYGDTAAPSAAPNAAPNVDTFVQDSARRVSEERKRTNQSSPSVSNW